MNSSRRTGPAKALAVEPHSELPQALMRSEAEVRDDSDSDCDFRIQRPRRAAPESIVRPTRAEINLGALRANVAVLRRAAGAAKLWAVLKADGYGHGSPAVARTLERAKVDGFCVALLEEAIELREAGISVPILVMGGYYGRAYAELAAYRVTPVIYADEHLQGLAAVAKKNGRPITAHLKIDTGMARLGVSLEHVDAFAARLLATPEVRITGLMTHFANADRPDPEDMQEQIARFDQATAQLARHGIAPAIRHSGNSAALLRGAGLQDAVRPGIAFFGASPFATDFDAPLAAQLEPVMRVRSQLVDVRALPAGRPLGYGGIFRTTRDSIVATLAMGYADGLARGASNRGIVLVRGKRAPIVGAVSMDMTMIDVTDIPGVALGDEVVVLGRQEGPLGKDLLRAEEVAAFSGLIPWEVLTHVSRRVPRFYREP